MQLLDRVFERLGFGGPIARGERRIWASARTLADLGELTARWLTGDLKSQPGYYGPCDVDEDDAPGLTAALVACNRAGFLTHNSQAGFNGEGYDGAHWKLRAAVVGFADGGTLDRLAAAVAGTRFEVVAHRVRTSKRQPGVIVTTRELQAFTTFGEQLSDREIAFLYGGCPTAAVDALRDAWQVTVYDPWWGRNDLWQVLAEAAADWGRT